MRSQIEVGKILIVKTSQMLFVSTIIKKVFKSTIFPSFLKKKCQKIVSILAISTPMTDIKKEGLQYILRFWYLIKFSKHFNLQLKVLLNLISKINAMHLDIAQKLDI